MLQSWITSLLEMTGIILMLMKELYGHETTEDRLFFALSIRIQE